MAVGKKLKEQVGAKFNGLCAYTGKPLDEKWQVDHVKPCYSTWTDEELQRCTKLERGGDEIDNLLPAIRIVNHYKRSLDLEGFREYMLTFHTRLAKLPKKTLVPETERRIKYMNEVAAHFDITVDKPFNGIFYFETISK